MTNKQVLELRNGLEANMKGLKELRGMKFAYALNKNIKILNDEIATFTPLIETSEEFKTFENERKELCELHCERDENGEMILIENNTQYAIDITSKEWQSAYKELENKFETTIKERSKQIEDYGAFLLDESNISLHKIEIDNVPDNISVEEFELIQSFIKD